MNTSPKLIVKIGPYNKHNPAKKLQYMEYYKIPHTKQETSFGVSKHMKLPSRLTWICHKTSSINHAGHHTLSTGG